MSMTTCLSTAEVVQVVEKVQEVGDTWLHCWGPQEQRAICAVSHGAQVGSAQVAPASRESLPPPLPAGKLGGGQGTASPPRGLVDLCAPRLDLLGLGFPLCTRG